MAEMRAGAEFAGYQIEGLAGRGGMGVVYKAMDVRLGRPVAIKLIAPHLSGDPMFRVRFEREARLAAMIRHPSVITVYGAGEQEGQLYVVMEYIAGTDLRATIDEEGKLDPARAAGIIHQVAGALDAAHARALVHRDVKPANVLIAALDGREEAYLTDFGLTKHTASDSGLTGTGMFVGTLDYVAPEQIAGEQVDARTDVYSLGCVLYHALTGQVPFPRSNQLATLYAHAHEPPPDIRAVRPDLNGALADVVATALAKEPADRYPAAGDMGQAALSAAVQAETVAPPPPRPPPLQATRIRQRERIASIKVAAPPEGLYAEGGTVWVALPEEDRVLRVDARTCTVMGEPIDVGGRPVAIAGEGSLVAVANEADGTITRIDASTGATIGEDVPTWAAKRRKKRWRGAPEEFPPDWKSPVPTTELFAAGAEIAVDLGTIWVTVPATDEVVRIDSTDDEITRSALRVGGSPIALTVAAGCIWVASYTGDTVSQIDGEWDVVVGDPLRVPDGPVAICSSGDDVWVLGGNPRSLTRIDSVSGRVSGNPLFVSRGADAMAPWAGDLWLLDAEEAAIARFNTRSQTIVETFPVQGSPTAIAISEGDIWVAIEEEALVRISI